MPESMKLYDNLGTEYETAELLLSRWDGAQIFRLVSNRVTVDGKFNVVLVHPSGRPEILHREMEQIRGAFSNLSECDPARVLYPCRMVNDDSTEVNGYLGWLPEDEDVLIPIDADADPVWMLTAARSLVDLFEAMGDERSYLNQADPDGFYWNDKGNRIYYLSADVSMDLLSQRDDYVNYVAPELLIRNNMKADQKILQTAADYVLSVLLYRMFVGSCPFCGAEPAERICDGISVFYDDSTMEYSRCIDRLSRLDPSLIHMFRRAFDYSRRSKYTSGRPTAGDWHKALDEILNQKYREG